MSNTNVLISKTKETINRYNMLSQGDRVVIGVSGGADSVALLRALHELRATMGITLSVCHVNHMLRETALRDEEFVLALCADLDVPCYIHRADVAALAKEWKVGTEEAGRRVRYEFFAHVLAVTNANKIATAHNLNDNVETSIMRFIRGASVHGLAGIPHKRDNIIRPLLDVSRDDIISFLSSIEQPYMTDETNLTTDYTRNKIRLDLLPTIIKDYNPNFIHTLASNMEGYREQDDFVNSCANRYMVHGIAYKANEISMDRYVLLKEHDVVIKRIFLISCQQHFKRALSSKQLSDIVHLLRSKNYANIELTNTMELRITRQTVRIIIKAPKEKDMSVLFLHIDSATDDIVSYGGRVFKISIDDFKDVWNSRETFYLPISLADGAIAFATKREGDKIEMESNRHKLLKKFFNEYRVAPSEREHRPLLLVNGVVMWVPGIYARRLSPEERTGTFVKFELLND